LFATLIAYFGYFEKFNHFLSFTPKTVPPFKRLFQTVPEFLSTDRSKQFPVWIFWNGYISAQNQNKVNNDFYLIHYLL